MQQRLVHLYDVSMYYYLWYQSHFSYIRAIDCINLPPIDIAHLLHHSGKHVKRLARQMGRLLGKHVKRLARQLDRLLRKLVKRLARQLGTMKNNNPSD